MTHTFAPYVSQTSSLLDALSLPRNGEPGQLAEMGARMLRNHNLRKQDADRARELCAKFGGAPLSGRTGDDSRIPTAMRLAAVAWQEANMCATAGETLLSRVIGEHEAGLQATATPHLIAEVVEMRARATDLLYDVLTLVR